MKAKDIFVKIKSWFAIKIGNRPVVYGIKYLPVICTGLASLHIGLGLMGIRESILLGLAVALLAILVILLSIRFKFCMLHKMMLVFLCLMIACVGIDSKGNIGPVLSWMRLIVFALGVCLVVLSVLKHKGEDECDKQ